MKRHRCAIVIGTRPEAIKMAPIVAALKADSLIEPVVVVTGQHDELMAPVLRFFELEADFKLNVLVPGQSLALLNSRLLSMLDGVVRDKQIDSVMVQGDTTSAMAGATVGFYHRLPVFHVEAGLRTNDIYAPFPEEFNRRVIDQVATLKFPPTEIALQNLEKDGLQANSIVVGNSVIDALLLGLRLIDERGQERYNAWMNGIGFQAGRRRILVTTHRRENIGEPLLNICRALRTLSDRYPDLEIALPVHKNPAFFSVIHEELGGRDRIYLLDPLPYDELIWLMNQSDIIVTDSGGLQEEAPALDKPVIVLREVTERPEGVDAGCARLVGTDFSKIVESVSMLLNDSATYQSMAQCLNPYGDGTTSDQIIRHIHQYLHRNRLGEGSYAST